MEFCNKCKAVMFPVKNGKTRYMKCKQCGNRKSIVQTDFKLQKMPKKEKIKVFEKVEAELPITHKLCPRCGRERAYWWTQQTMAAEEAPTNFFRCTKCTYTWRES